MNTQTIQKLAGNATVCGAVARLHVDANAAECMRAAFAAVANVQTARARDIAYFAAACMRAHYANRARYSVAVRCAVTGRTS